MSSARSVELPRVWRMPEITLRLLTSSTRSATAERAGLGLLGPADAIVVIAAAPTEATTATKGRQPTIT